MKRRTKKIIAGVAAVSVALIGLGAMVSEPEPRPVQVIEYTVLPGDTLWHIAAEHRADDQDIRDVVDKIQADSGLKSGGELRPGQVLIIKKELPVGEPADNSSAKTKY